MFDIGFFELLFVAVIGLIVIGPERLPGAVKTCALWWGRFKRGLHNTRSEIEQQIGADDIRRQLHNEEVMMRLQASKDAINKTVSENISDIQNSLELDNSPESDKSTEINNVVESTQSAENQNPVASSNKQSEKDL